MKHANRCSASSRKLPNLASEFRSCMSRCAQPGLQAPVPGSSGKNATSQLPCEILQSANPRRAYEGLLCCRTMLHTNDLHPE